MPIKLGTTGIASIFKGTIKIGSVYKGTTLVFQSDTVYHSNIVFQGVRRDSSGNNEYVYASGTAVAGTTYYSYNSTTRTYNAVSVAEGASVSGYYTLNASFVSANTVGAYIYSIISVPNVSQLIIGQVQIGNDWYDITGSQTLDFKSYATSNVTELIIYNVDKYDAENSDKVISGVRLDFNGANGLNNCAKITVISSCVYFRTTNNDTRIPNIGLNVSNGVDVIFKNVIYIPSYFSGNDLDDYAGSNKYDGIRLFKSVTFDCPNLKYIGDCALISSSLNNTVSIEYLGTELPQSLIYLGSRNDSIASSSSSGDNLVYNIKGSQNKWRVVTSGTIPSDTYGLASPKISKIQTGTSYATVSLSSYDLPSSLQAVSKATLVSSSAQTFGIHNNIFTPPITNSSNNNAFVGAYTHTFDFASNVTSIPAVVFENMSGISKIYIRCPDGTPVDIAYHAFYYKSARTVSIYTDNQAVKNYDWSGNQNITATFYHLDGTAW